MTPWKPVSAVLAGLVLIGSAAAAFDRLRPFAYVSELQEIAGVSLTTAINQRYDFLILERRELQLCRQAAQNCTQIERRIQRLERQIRDLEAKRAKYGG